MHVRLVSKETWTTLTHSLFHSLSPDTRRAARSILRTMHNRHIGITPELAAQLAPLILEPTAALQAEGAWAHVLARLTKELDVTHRQHSPSRRQGFGLLFSAIPPYSVIRLAMPIVEEACRRTGLCCLFCEDEIDGVPDEEYRRYSEKLSAEIERMAMQGDDFFQIFWKERALTLAGYSRRPGTWGEPAAGLPETDPPASGLLLRLNPQTTVPKPLSHPPKPMTSPLKHKESLKSRVGGFSGIRVTRQAEEMENILMSEFMNPPLLLADRLVNSGYLALKRKPRHERLRDVLIAGLMPHEVRPRLNVDFTKACWFDFITRFGLMLARHRLKRSEFRWLEGDTFGRCKNCRFQLEDLPMPGSPVEWEPTPAYRQGFLVALGWFPSFLDTLNGFDPVPDPADRAGETDPMMHWAYSAWKGQKLRQKTPLSVDVDEFAFVHIMLFLPEKKRGKPDDPLPPPQARLRQMHRGLEIGAASGRSASITWVPEVPEDTKKWAVDRQKKRTSRLFPAAQPGATWEDIAGQLEQVWLQHMIEEIRNV